MFYKLWYQQHYKKHKQIMQKLTNLTNDEIIKYFRYNNMLKKELDFCPLYKKRQNAIILKI